MADLSPSAASVAPYANAVKVNGVAGAALTIGLAVYKKSSDKKWYTSDNDVVADAADEYGYTLTNAAAADQPVVVQVDGDYNPGAVLAVGLIYCVGAGAGATAPAADVTAAKSMRPMGLALTTTKLRLFNLAARVQTTVA